MRTTRTGRGPPAVRVLLRSAALVLGAAAAMLLLAQPASAHANLVRSDPTDGSVLAHAPSVARLWFSEGISPGFSSARVVGHTGATISGSHSQAGGGDPRQLTVELPSLGTGTYGLVWRVLAEDDGHTTSGVVVFTVGGAGAAAGTIPVAASAGGAGTAATPVGVLLRWLGLCALAGLVGCLAVAGPVLGRARAASVPDTVAGALALLLQAFPGMSADRQAAALETARPTSGQPARTTATGMAASTRSPPTSGW